jgi:RNA polymerase II subunit A small phosphatase-like protein
MKFIETIGLNYEIVVFTAAKNEYAPKVINEIDRNGCKNHILYRESCTIFDGKYIKDLSKLGRSLNNVIVDDIPFSYKLKPKNGIHISPYTGEENDDSLLELMTFLRRLPNNR